MDRPARLTPSGDIAPLSVLLFASPDCTTALWGDERYLPPLSELKEHQVDPQLRAFAKSRQLEVECVREVLSVMAAGPLLNGTSVMDALSQRLAAAAPLVPPLVVLRGELELSFDAEAQLTVAADVAEALTEDDEAVRDAARLARAARAAAQDARILAAHLQRLQNALAASVADAQDAATATTQLLHQQQHYTQRKVFGSNHILLQLRLAGEPQPIPCYLDFEYLRELPLLRRFEAKLLAEVHPAQDPADVGAYCLRVVALAREVVAEHWTAGQWPSGPDKPSAAEGA